MKVYRSIKRTKTILAIGSCLLSLLLSCKGKEAQLFASLPSHATSITFRNEVHDNDSLNILDYLYFYNGGGVAIGDINNDGLQDIYFTANKAGGNRLYLNKGRFQFEDITTKAGVAGTADWCTGVTMADVNGDGWLDIYVSAVAGKLGLKGHNALYINNGNNTFSEKSAEYGLGFVGYATQAAFFDFDHDNDLDCYLLNQSDHSVEFYRDTSNRRKVSPKAGDRLYRNDNGHFTDVTMQAGIYSSGLGYGLGLGISDLNNDGWDDIYVGNDFHENDYYYINNQDGTFTESGAKAFGHYSRFSMGNDIADYNNDGMLDMITVDMLPYDEKVLKTYGGEESLDIYQYKITGNGFQNQYSRNCLQVNIDNGKRFSDVALQAGVAATDWSWSPLFADFDNDGIKDLFISNGIQKRMLDLDYIKFVSSSSVQQALLMSHQFDKEVLQQIPDGKCHNFIYKGTKEGAFNDQSEGWGFSQPTVSSGAAYADLDNDGDLDLVVNRSNEEAGIYENRATGMHYLQLSFKGAGKNTMGVGVKAFLFTKEGIQMQELMLTRGFQSSVPALLHFGLDTLSYIDSLVVVWPNNHSQTVKKLATNQRIVIQQKNAVDTFSYTRIFGNKQPMLADVTTSTKLNWGHKENVFYDFNRQYLIPHELSTEGPKMAVGDVNGDGLDDIFLCGAKQQSSALYIQNSHGQFESSNIALWAADSLSEDVDAFFFDADNDKDLDLYVVTGGNEYNKGNAWLLDRLYINDGKGQFTKAEHALPPIAENKSCVSVADINNDGLMDLFVGGRSDPMSYGKPCASYILLNTGKGTFVDVSQKWLGSVQELGMVTDAVFEDFDKDGKMDLVVVGEWMPVTFLLNKGDHFENVTNKVAPPKLNGWWYFIIGADIDKDGDIDFLVGNYGTNSKLKASAAEPVRLYLGDWDKNGTSDPLLCINIEGKYYPFLNKEELEKQLPFIKKKFLGYQAMADKSIDQIFDKAALDNAAVLNAYNFSSGVLRNDGKGSFHWQPFPATAQTAPVFSILYADINRDNKPDILGGGNFYGVLPYEGRYDASQLWWLQPTGKNGFEVIPPILSQFYLTGEVRDIKTVRSVNRTQYLAIARNNDSVKLFR